MTADLRRPSRRLLLAGLAALPLSACVGDGPPAPRVARFRAVTVDTSPFAAKGVSGYAAHVADVLRRAVEATFAGRIEAGDRGAPALVIEVSSLRLAPYSGGATAGVFGTASDRMDEMEGALVLSSAAGKTIDRRRHYASTDAASTGFWYRPDFEEKRLEALALAYARWALREYGD
jgi:hypothetical protein